MNQKINSRLFEDTDTEETSGGSTSQDEDLHPKTQMVLDKQLEIIRDGDKFLEDLRKLFVLVNTVKRAIRKELQNAHTVELKLDSEDVKALDSKISGLVSSVTTATKQCNDAVTTVSDDTKEKFDKVYEGIGDKMKADVDAYMKKRVEDTIKVVDNHCDAVEERVKGHFMSNTAYYIHYFLLIVSLAFGFWGLWHFVPFYVTAAMGWSIVAIAAVTAYGILLYKLRDL